MLDDPRRPSYTWLITSHDRLPDRAMRGYAFLGADLVLGQPGLESYEQRHRMVAGALAPDEDGAYAVLTRHRADGDWILGTDYKGFHKVFFYSGSWGWAVSNSFAALVRRLHAEDVDLTGNSPVTAAFSARIDMVRTLMTFDTAVEEITLLPSGACLRLRPGPDARLTMERLPRPDEQISYADALIRFLDVWQARLAGAFSDSRTESSLHLTGGRDSRTVFALAATARRRAGHEAVRRIRHFSSPRREIDMAIARQIAEHYAIELNTKVSDRLRGRELTGPERYQSWLDGFVGCYGHTMLPANVVAATFLTCAGVGGERIGTSIGPASGMSRSAMSPRTAGPGSPTPPLPTGGANNWNVPMTTCEVMPMPTSRPSCGAIGSSGIASTPAKRRCGAPH